MSTFSKLASKEQADIEAAAKKVSQLGIPYNAEQAKRLYEKLSSLGTYEVSGTKTPPGVKGFDLALHSYLILAGLKEPEYIPLIEDTDAGMVIGQMARPVNILIGGETPKERNLAEAMNRGYRLGLYVIGKASPLIQYVDSNIPQDQMKVIARHLDSDRVLIGQQVTHGSAVHFDMGYYGSYPSNAESVFSYTVFPLIQAPEQLL